ncbi:MAG: hypothetical protein PQJ60_05310 [Spirochaetales bacterium]|nr:hypothetical protein [Spirochaetales bacterium]
MSVLGSVAAQQVELSVGPGYEFYGIQAETGAADLELHYHSLGVNLGASCLFAPEWGAEATLFLGIPVSDHGYLSDGTDDSIGLSEYDLYRYFIKFSLGPTYRYSQPDYSLTFGPQLVFNDLVLAASDDDPSYVISYTVGLGALCRFQYYFDKWIFYTDLQGSWNFSEILVDHDDFDYAYGATVSLGVLWRF